GRLGRGGVRPAPVWHGGCRQWRLPGRRACRARTRAAVRHRNQGRHDRAWLSDGAARGGRRLGDLRAAAARGRDGEGGNQPPPVRVAARTAAREEDADRTDRASPARERARDDQARPPAGARVARRDPRRRGRSRPAHRRGVARPRTRRVVTLCLVDDDPVSLEALTFAARLGDVEALVFGETDVSGYASLARRVMHERLDEYAPDAWAQAIVELEPKLVVAP